MTTGITYTSGNDTYRILPWDDGRWVWTGGYECDGDFATAEEALADARRHAGEMDRQYTESDEYREGRAKEMMFELRREEI